VADPENTRQGFAMHRAAPTAGDPLPCCGKRAEELPPRHVLTHDDNLVTCPDRKAQP
jgi:hypothetical protein